MKLPKNVDVRELGGGTVKRRATAIVKMLFSLIHIILGSKNRFVFYHMNTRAALIVGLPLKILRIPQILWYSHAHASFALKIASKWVDKIVSTSPNSFPFLTKKLISTGHGVRDRNVLRLIQDIPTYSISFLGRISPVKRLEILIDEVAIFQNSKDFHLKVYLIGPCEGTRDERYKSELIARAKSKDVQVIFVTPVRHENVQFELLKYDLAYNGTLQSLDKGVIESVFAKCIIISDQKNTLMECGYSNFSLDSSGEAIKISKQLSLIVGLSVAEITDLTENAKNETLSRHSLSSTIDKICVEFTKVKSRK
jgi:glycosyltransferase involved in cell wall biosynthesis